MHRDDCAKIVANIKVLEALKLRKGHKKHVVMDEEGMPESMKDLRATVSQQDILKLTKEVHKSHSVFRRVEKDRNIFEDPSSKAVNKQNEKS